MLSLMYLTDYESGLLPTKGWSHETRGNTGMNYSHIISNLFNLRKIIWFNGIIMN